MRTRSWRVVLVLLSFSAPAAGQTVISEADALARLSTDSPRVRAIRAAAEIARADVLLAGRWPNPRATYNRESVSGVTENMVTVTQPLPRNHSSRMAKVQWTRMGMPATRNRVSEPRNTRRLYRLGAAPSRAGGARRPGSLGGGRRTRAFGWVPGRGRDVA